MKRLIPFLPFLLVIVSAQAQFPEDSLEYSVPLERSLLQRYEEALSAKDVSFHTAFRPWTTMELRKVIPFDSLNSFPVKDSHFNKTWLGRKLRTEHLFTVNEPDFRLTVDPLFDFSFSRETEYKKNLYVNSRGARILGNLNKISFYTGFYETQATFPHYLDLFINTFDVVPGQGKVKRIEGAYDYVMAFGGVTYTPSQYFNVQLAHDKNFIGDGYRSLLLSDNSFNYPFLKLTAEVWRIKYSVLYAQFLDLLSPHDPDIGYRKKYGTFHYLDIRIAKRLYFGFFEGVIWKSDSLGSRNFEINYLNPVIFLRPVEGSLDSPDNMMLGSNIRYKISDKTSFYGQLLLDEFKLNEIKAGNGWWGNKQAFQVGLKTFSIAGIKNLNLQGELNFVRPYTYEHRSTLQNYAHYNQALAHPLGANFIEEVFLADYRIKRWHATAKIITAEIGRDMNGENYGSNIFKDYFSYRSQYGNKVLQGLKTDFLYYELKAGYLVNPVYNFNVEIGVASRELKNTVFDEKAMVFTFGIRTSLQNKYYDF
jgi:hypothetical protein